VAYGSVQASPLPAAQARPGALLLQPADSLDEDLGRSPGNGRRRKQTLLWVLAAAVVAALAALALVFLPAAGRVTVPDVTGQSEQVAIRELRRAGLSPVASLASSATVASGRVILQSPPRGRVVGRGTRVDVVVSSGPGSKALANVQRLSVAQAVARLRAAGFKPTTTTQPSSTVMQGQVIGTNPPAGTELQVGSPVTVLVSSGPAQVRVPNITGQSRGSAEAALTTAGLAVGIVTQQTVAGQAAGTVLSQSPNGGTSLPAGGVVNLVVAQATNEVTVPNVVGQNQTQAAAALGAAGLNPRTVSATTTEPAQVGVVLKQKPSAGKLTPKGARVTITVGVLGPQTTPTPTTPQPTTTTTTTPPPVPPG
jgi:beta-lactam-binding protein with PASTA domain